MARGLAYIILAHKLPNQLARLVAALHTDDDLFVLHIDAKTDVEPFRDALRDRGLRRPNIRLLEPRQRVNWGDYGTVRASLAGLRAALEASDLWDHAVLLSGQCYPIKPRDQIARTLAEAGERSFLSTAPTTDFRRLTHHHFQIAGRRVTVPNRFTAGLPLPRRLPFGLKPRHGSAWWALRREAADWFVDYDAANPELRRFFRSAFIPDEYFYQVLSQASPFADRIINEELHFIDWDGWHPRVLQTADAPALMRSPALFARKFDESVDAAVLDQLDGHLAGREQEVGAPG